MVLSVKKMLKSKKLPISYKKVTKKLPTSSTVITSLVYICNFVTKIY